VVEENRRTNRTGVNAFDKSTGGRLWSLCDPVWGATLKLSVERIVASALGASLGAPACDIFHVTGIDCGCFHLNQRFSLTGLGPRDFFDPQNGRQTKLTETQCLHAKFTSIASVTWSFS
jgi:hypothetical protein